MSSARTNERVIVYEPVLLRAGSRRWPARLMDVSESGARIESPESPDADLVWLEWTPVPDMRTMHLQARVMWRQKHVFGLQFEAMSERESFFLRALVRHHRNEDQSTER